MFAAVVAIYFVYGSNLPAGYIGFTLSMLVNFAGAVLSWVRSYNDLELEGKNL